MFCRKLWQTSWKCGEKWRCCVTHSRVVLRDLWRTDAPDVNLCAWARNRPMLKKKYTRWKQVDCDLEQALPITWSVGSMKSQAWSVFINHIIADNITMLIQTLLRGQLFVASTKWDSNFAKKNFFKNEENEFVRNHKPYIQGTIYCFTVHVWWVSQLSQSLVDKLWSG